MHYTFEREPSLCRDGKAGRGPAGGARGQADDRRVGQDFLVCTLGGQMTG